MVLNNYNNIVVFDTMNIVNNTSNEKGALFLLYHTKANFKNCYIIRNTIKNMFSNMKINDDPNKQEYTDSELTLSDCIIQKYSYPDNNEYQMKQNNNDRLVIKQSGNSYTEDIFLETHVLTHYANDICQVLVSAPPVPDPTPAQTYPTDCKFYSNNHKVKQVLLKTKITSKLLPAILTSWD